MFQKVSGNVGKSGKVSGMQGPLVATPLQISMAGATFRNSGPGIAHEDEGDKLTQDLVATFPRSR